MLDGKRFSFQSVIWEFKLQAQLFEVAPANWVFAGELHDYYVLAFHNGYVLNILIILLRMLFIFSIEEPFNAGLLSALCINFSMLS